MLQDEFEPILCQTHIGLGVVEEFCLISKHNLCLDQNIYLLCRIIAVWELLGSDTFEILMLDIMEFQNINSVFRINIITALFLMTLLPPLRVLFRDTKSTKSVIVM